MPVCLDMLCPPLRLSDFLVVLELAFRFLLSAFGSCAFAFFPAFLSM
jgi:hypothetical protein